MSDDLQQWLEWAAGSDKPRKAGHYIFRGSIAAGRLGDRETIDRLWAAAHEAGFLRFSDYRIQISEVWDGPEFDGDGWDEDDILVVENIGDGNGLVTETGWGDRTKQVPLSHCFRDDILTEAGAEAVNALRLANGKPDANGWVRFDVENGRTWPEEVGQDVFYLVRQGYPDAPLTVAWLDADDAVWWLDGEEYTASNVTHWRDLPAGPVEEA